MTGQETNRLGVDVILNDIKNNPVCSHGPTILFERYLGDGSSRQFYACSACRSRRDCSFFHWADDTISKEKREEMEEMATSVNPTKDRKMLRIRFDTLKKMESEKRLYCHSCSILLLPEDHSNHLDCKKVGPLSDSQLTCPSTVFLPILNSKFEAQYLFVEKTVKVLLKMVQDCDATHVLCIGSPRVHEAIALDSGYGVKSLLLDIDDRFCNFLGVEDFLVYNLFNNHLFEGTEANLTLDNYLKEAKKLVVVCDPPFGGRMELITRTLQLLEDQWRTLTCQPQTKSLPVLLAFPYFLERQLLTKLPGYTMLDYQADYDNHPLYSSGEKGMKNGSAVRIFVNLPAKNFPLPKDEGYKYCKLCERWVYKGNNHCDKCSGCMSKDGRTYKHCNDCRRCVKPSWIHCLQCLQCYPQDHKCRKVATMLLGPTCHICGELGHKRRDCTNKKRKIQEDFSKKIFKRKQK